MRTLFAVVAILVAAFAFMARAEGNLATRAERLEPLLLDAAEGFSIKRYEIETGQFYRLRVTSDGREEHMFRVPERSRSRVCC